MPSATGSSSSTLAPPSPSHSYPPTQRRQPQSQPTSNQNASQDSIPQLLSSYQVNTATDSLHDLRLQVTQDPNPIYSTSTNASKSNQQHIQSAKGKTPMRPIWFRERILTQYDEIVDRIVDANTALVAWTIHRPVRGWYIHLRSPSLPTGTAIPLRPARTAASDITSTPLTFSLGTSLNRSHALDRRNDSNNPSGIGLKESIDEVIQEYEKAKEVKSENLNEFTTITLNESSSSSQSRVNALSLNNPRYPSSRKVDDEGEEGEGEVSGSGESRAQASSISVRENATGHARKRSSGGSGSHSNLQNNSSATGSGTSRKVSNIMREGEAGKLARETLGEEDESEDSTSTLTTNQKTNNENQSQTSRLKLQTQPSSNPTSKPRRGGPNSDRPYSPIEPHSISTSTLATSNQNRNGNQNADRGGNHSRPTHCSFLITDGPSSTSKGWNLESSLAPGRILSENLHSKNRLSWARWVWGMVPNPIRPPLAFDTSKNFSLRWVDPPIGFVSKPNSNQNPTSNQNDSNFSIPGDRRSDEIGSRNNQDGPTSNNGDEEMIKPGSVIDKDSLGPGIEILKFEDRSGWWFWGNTKGRLILQENAIKTLGLDRTFWIAVALAYLEFLEERDGYNAAADG